MKWLRKLIKKRIFEEQFVTDQISEQVINLLVDMDKKGILTINENFTILTEYDAFKKKVRVYYNEKLTLVDNLLFSLNIPWKDNR